MTSNLDVASTFLVGAVGASLPELIGGWGGAIGSIVSAIWVIYQLISRIRSDIKKIRKRKK